MPDATPSLAERLDAIQAAVADIGQQFKFRSEPRSLAVTQLAAQIADLAACVRELAERLPPEHDGEGFNAD